MARGRRSSSALAISVPLDASNVEALGRLKPPEGLSLAELRVWKVTVGSKPPEWFGIEHVPVLLGYVRASAAADEWDRLAKALDKEDRDYPKLLARYCGLRKQETNQVNLLARAMRLTHQAAYRAASSLPRAANSEAKPWDTGDE